MELVGAVELAPLMRTFTISVSMLLANSTIDIRCNSGAFNNGRTGINLRGRCYNIHLVPKPTSTDSSGNRNINPPKHSTGKKTK
jgi:hypothetical protein